MSVSSIWVLVGDALWRGSSGFWYEVLLLAMGCGGGQLMVVILIERYTLVLKPNQKRDDIAICGLHAHAPARHATLVGTFTPV